MGLAPYGQPVSTHSGAVAAWGQSAHGLGGELLGVPAVVPGVHGDESDPRRRPTTPADMRLSPCASPRCAERGQQIMSASAPHGEQRDGGAACSTNLNLLDAHSSGSGEAAL